MPTRSDTYEQRVTAVRQKLAAWDVEGVLIASPANRRWLSGFTGSAGQLLITADTALLATDFRYWEQAVAQAPTFTLFKHNRTPENGRAFFVEAGASTIAIEADHTTLSNAKQIRKAGEGITFKPIKSAIEPLRAIKTADEIETIRAAAAITDEVMAQFPDIARPGITEKEAAWELEKRMRELGADGMAFEVIVAAGENAALPHHRPTDRELRMGDPIIVDMGAMLNGYHSDMTRTFFLGEPDEQFWAVYNLVLAAQTAVLDNLKPGLNGKEADALARDVIAAAGHGDHFGHGLGHGVGLEIHETPFLSVRSEKTTLAAGMTATIEPGVYLPGWGGVRIEDLVYLTENGIAFLSHCPKTPVISITH
ncbi:MAG: M24 family metallopeptidase [Anaerolineae bacterium]